MRACLKVEGEVEEVQWEEAEHVHIEGGGVHVVQPELGGVRLQHPVLQVGCTQQVQQHSLVNNSL